MLERLGAGAAGNGAVLPAASAVVAAVVLSGVVWMFPATYLPRLLVPALRRRDPMPPIAVPIIMSWAGMRGVVSLAAALSLPDGFSGRDFILATTFLVILVTVLVQGATLAPLILMLGLSEFILKQPDTLSEDEARARVAEAQLRAVEVEADRHPRLLEQYRWRVRATANFLAAQGALNEDRSEHFRVVLTANAAGRAALLQMHRDGQIRDRVLHNLEQDLDLEELGASRFQDDG